ncbi:MAG TPA: lantibiotic dehydratase C-terminal domain-containing protein [Pseudonocardiaceae bacterium]|nr:lantibiotic dehydratase C-terminal domain-containing protein [Pseudonocardiaceae bacterium]
MPSTDEGASWHSLHVHRYSGQDEFITDGLRPVLAPLLSCGAVSRFFFLRYWQGGHHVRVRLLLADGSVAGEVAAKLGAYLAEHPGDGGFDAERFAREAQPTMAALEGERISEIHPEDTILRAEYEPELAKYGGPLGVAVAEEYFARSSEIAIDAIGDIAGRSGRRLGVGFSTMLRGLCAAGLTPPEMAGFFAHYCVLWAPYVFDQFRAAWPDLLRERRSVLLPHAETLLARADRLAKTDRFAGAIAAARSAVHAAGDEVLGRVTLAGADATAARRWQVLLVGYLHTHNNRIGLIPEHEAFLGYLGHHVLSEYTGREPQAGLADDIQRYRDRRLAAVAGAPKEDR